MSATRPAQPTERTIDPVRLQPDLAAALRWSFWAAVLTGAMSWFVVDSHGHPFAWLGLVVATLMFGWYLAQLFLPSQFQIILDPDVLWVRLGSRRFTIDWEQVYVVRIRHVLGDPVLEVKLGTIVGNRIEPADRRLVPFPVGAQERDVHRFLAARLGHGSLPPVRLAPLDL